MDKLYRMNLDLGGVEEAIKEIINDHLENNNTFELQCAHCGEYLILDEQPEIDDYGSVKFSVLSCDCIKHS